MSNRLFKTEDVKRFFNKLYNLGRTTCKRYDNLCEREVFVRRTVNKYLKGYYVILYTQDESTGITYKRYVSINSIRYALDYGNNLNVYITDYARPYNWFNDIKIGHNEALGLEGLLLMVKNINYYINSHQWMTLKTRSLFIAGMISLNTPLARRRGKQKMILES